MSALLTVVLRTFRSGRSVRGYSRFVPSSERDPWPGDTTSTARARLRMVRVRAEQALGEKDRRADSAARPPVGRDARSIALAQLRQIADMPGDVIEPLVLNRSALRECPGADAEVVRAFAEQILQQRRRREAQEKVFFRREDIDTLSRLLQCSADGVNPLLDRLGVLA